MISQPLQFQRHAAQHLRARRHLAAGQTFDSLTVRHCVAHRRIARQRFHVMNCALARPALERPFHAAMLVAKRDFQVKHLFAVALETKVSWLDYPGVNWADGDLVNFFAFDPVKVHDAHKPLLVSRPAPGVMAGTLRFNEPHGLEPRMTFGSHAELFGNLALE